MDRKEIIRLLGEADQEYRQLKQVWEQAVEALNRARLAGQKSDEYKALKAEESRHSKAMRAAYQKRLELERLLTNHPEERAKKQREKAARSRSRWGDGFGINEYGSDYVAWAYKHKD